MKMIANFYRAIACSAAPHEQKENRFLLVQVAGVIDVIKTTGGFNFFVRKIE